MRRSDVCGLVGAMILISTGGASAAVLVSQNFDSIGPGGTAPPAGWTIGHLNPVTNRVASDALGAHSMVSEALIVDNGSKTGATNGESYNYGTTGAADRALGNIPRTPNGDHVIQVAVTNNLGYALTSINLSYAGEQWHLGESKAGGASTKPEKLRVYYSVSPTSGFARMTSSIFDFIVPQDLPGQPQAALDGNAAANRVLISGSYAPAAPIAPGATFYIRWHDYNEDQTLDHGLAIDDVVIEGVPEPSAIVLLALGGLALRRRR